MPGFRALDEEIALARIDRLQAKEEHGGLQELRARVYFALEDFPEPVELGKQCEAILRRRHLHFFREAPAADRAQRKAEALGGEAVAPEPRRGFQQKRPRNKARFS